MQKRPLAAGLYAAVCLLGPVVSGFSAERVVTAVQQMDLRGMGYVTGLVGHPSNANVVYARTDVAGVFRWDPTGLRWVPLMDDESPDTGIEMNIESVAIDPGNTNRIFAAFGEYVEDGTGRDGLARSDDRGDTWQILAGFPTNIEMGANNDWRWCGERIQVDPRNSDYVYFGSRQDSLWRSTNAGVTWAQIAGVPYGDNGGKTRNSKPVNAGITFVAIDARATTGTPARSAVVYLGIMSNGIYRSTNGGDSFSKVSDLAGGPDSYLKSKPVQGKVATNGTLYVTFWDSGVFRLQGNTWSNVTPPVSKCWYERSWVGIAVDPQNSLRIAVTAQGETPKDIMLSENSGNSWINMGPDAAYARRWTYEAPGWWPSTYLNGLAGGALFHPTRSNELWWTGGYGVHACSNVTLSTPIVNIRGYMKGLEELVATQAIGLPAPATNRFLVTSMDMGGFAFQDSSTVPTQRLSTLAIANGTGIAVSYQQPSNLVTVGEDHGYASGYARRSFDGGQTWSDFVSVPNSSRGGNVALAANNPKNMVWVPRNAVPVVTANAGTNWTAVSGLPSSSNPISSPWFNSVVLAADTVNSGTFYFYEEYYSPKARIYRSTNGGSSFSIVNSTTIPGSWQVKMEAAPGIANEVWVGLPDYGTSSLWYSTNGGVSFSSVTSLTTCSTFTLGRALPGNTAPTVWAEGTYGGVSGVFVSTNRGKAWDRVDFGGRVPSSGLGCLGADLQADGGLVLGYGGRGFFHAQVPMQEPDFDGDGQPDSADPDDDNDGMPDTWEVRYGFNPTNAGAGTLTDADALTDYEEFIAGTDPTNAGSRLAVSGFIPQPSNTAVMLAFDAVSGRYYRVLGLFDLFSNNWQVVESNFYAASNGLHSVSDSTAATSRFYRVKVRMGSW